MFLSVVIPTYNRLPILRQCLEALQRQWVAAPLLDYEVVVVDDGSTDATVAWIEAEQDQGGLDRVRLIRQEHAGPAAGRNNGVQASRGDVIVFIDSDLVVTERFLHSHATALSDDWRARGNQLCFTYGAVINTSNFQQPTVEPHKWRDLSWAYFATGNVAIAKTWLEQAGLFDAGFQLYGWEDLELGVRLKKLGLKLIPCPGAVGYHWHPPFSLEQIPRLIQQEEERGRMGVFFYQKHPTWEVRLMIQMTWLHRLLWGLLSLGGTLNERTLAPLLQGLIDRGRPQLALEIARIFLNWYNVRAVYGAYRAAQGAKS